MKAIGHRIPITSVEEGVAYYEKLGFECTFQAEEYGWASLVAGDFELGLYVPGKSRRTREPGENVGFLFQVADVNEMHAHCTEKGMDPSAMIDTPDGKQLFDMVDPFGNLLSFTD